MQLGDGVPTFEQLESEYAGDTERLCNDHEKLIEQILEEEEEVINGHRKHIDDVVDVVKHEMSLLNDVDKPGSDVESYVNDLDKLLVQKIEMITEMRKQLITFHGHLKTEEVMSKLYQQVQNLEDLEQEVNNNEYGDEDMLINDMQDMEDDIENQNVEDQEYFYE